MLALVAERRTHGFDVARTLAEDGDIGRIWTVPRPLVYRAIDALVGDGLVEEAGTAEGRGPRRVLVRATPAGRSAVRRWLEAPVAHVREVRGELLVKLALLHRSGRPWRALVDRQRDALAPTLTALRTQPPGEDFDAVLTAWRRTSAEAVDRFLQSLDDL